MATGSDEFLDAFYIALFGNDIHWIVSFGLLPACKGSDQS
jgi:hypothetical protein